uniref:Uncharacterized protein n=1 Tax=Ditylenchus dipsaci TaxID=166011 RepID=A0A915CRA0_9BILA
MQGLGDMGCRDGRMGEQMDNYYPSSLPVGQSNLVTKITTCMHAQQTLFVDTPIGIVHQFENTQNYYSASRNNWQTNIKQNSLRCPCCRNSNSEILCSSCASSFMRLNKIREARRVVFLRKAEVCRSIEEHLKAEINFESDYHRKQQLVNKLKAKIAEKAEHIQRVKHRIVSLQVNTSKNKKNVYLLEKKMSAHADRINRTTAEIEANRVNALKTQENLNKWILYVCSQLLDMLPFQRCDSRYGSGGEAWSGQDKQITYMINNCKVTEGGNQNDHQLLKDQLCSCSSALDHLCPDSRHTFAALVFTSQFANILATLLNCTLPYKHLTRDLSLTTKWTEDILDTVLFKLNYCIIKLCIVRGVPVRSLSFHRPFSNLYSLMAVLRGEKVMPITNNIAFDSKLRIQIIEEYQKVKWQETHDFTIDNVEEGDWVAVDFASNK